MGKEIETNSEKWDSLYKKGRQGKYPNEMLVRYINSIFPSDKRDEIRVLDLGFGTGRHLILLAEEGFEVHGIEYSRKGFEISERWLKQDNLKANIRLGSVLDEKLYGSGFDLIIDIACIQHNVWRDMEKIVLNVYNTLKPGGHFFSSMKNQHDSLSGQGQELDGLTRSYAKGVEKVVNSTIISFPTLDQVNDLFSSFEKVSIEKEGWTFAERTKIVSHWIISAQK